MKHPEGRITARIRSDRLLGCSSTSTGAGDAGRNTPTRIRKRHEQDAAQQGRNGGVTNHFSENPFPFVIANDGACFEQTMKTDNDGQGDEQFHEMGSGTILPRGGIPGSSSKIPTLGGMPNRSAPAPPGFITVTVLSTSSSNGRWLCPKMMISAF